MRRWTFSIVAVLSLVLFLATLALWVWSHKKPGRLISAALWGERYTLRSNHGRLTLLAPPRGGSASITNDQIEWYLHREHGWLGSDSNETIAVTFAVIGGGDRLPLDAKAGPRLVALETTDTFAAAHLALAYGPLTSSLLTSGLSHDAETVVGVGLVAAGDGVVAGAAQEQVVSRKSPPAPLRMRMSSDSAADWLSTKDVVPFRVT